MNEWAQHLNNPFALAGFTGLLLVGLIVHLLKSRYEFDEFRSRIITVITIGLLLLGAIGLLTSLALKPEQSKVERAVQTEPGDRHQSPSFGDVNGNVRIEYGSDSKKE